MTSTTKEFPDFDGFVRWYSARKLRSTGSAPKASTLKQKRIHLRTCMRETSLHDETSFADLLSDRARVEYLLDLLAARMTSGSMRSVVDAMRQYGEYAKVAGLSKAGCAVTEADRPPNNPDKPIVVYSVDEMERLVSCAMGRGLRWWAFLTMLADTGRRVGELLEMEWEWFRLGETPAYVELPRTKNGKAQYVPLPRRLREEVFTPENIVAMKRATRGEMGNAYGRSTELYPFPWHYSTVFNRFRRYCDFLGIECRGLHAVRHTVITRRLGAGVPIQAVSALAGHANPLITLKRYDHATSLDYLKYIDS